MPSQPQQGLKAHEKAVDLLCYLPEYRVIVCRVHGAVQNWDTHLKRSHSIPQKIRRAIQEQTGFNKLVVNAPKDIPLPAPLGRPFKVLGEPVNAFACQDQGCRFVCTNQDYIRQHCNQAHCWFATLTDPQHWDLVKAQTFFKTGRFRRYFTISLVTAAGRAATGSLDEATLISHEVQEAQSQRAQELDVAEATIAKTDRTGWFNRNGWPEHLSSRNLAQLSWASRLPDRHDAILCQAVKVVELAIEQSVAGLATLPLETRRWLRSPKSSEIDERPLARLQNLESQQRYASYIKRFICYCLRVAIAIREEGVSTAQQARRSTTYQRQASTSGSSASEGESDETSSSRNPVLTSHRDPLHDAKALFPWAGEQKELAIALVHSLHLDDEATQVRRALELLRALIFQEVNNDPFTSALVHFLAILGINPKTQRLRLAQDYSYMLAGVVYCMRVLSAEILLPAAQRSQQGKKERLVFLQYRQQYLVDGSYSPFSTMISLLAYAKHITLNTGNPATTQWSKDLGTLYLQGRPIVMARFKAMVAGVIGEAEDVLWEKLMMVPCQQDRFYIPLLDLEDDVSCVQRGYSLLSRLENRLEKGLEWTVKQLLKRPQGQSMRKNGQWQALAVRRYLREIDRFLEQLFFLAHVTGGQPARGTEIASARFRNSFMQDRNIYVMDGQVVFVSRYNKTQSQWDKPKVIPRFLPWPVSQLFLLYLVYISPLKEHLLHEVKGETPSDYIWSSNTGPWETDRLTRVLGRETGTWLGCRLTMLEYRHAVATIGREFVGQEFNYGAREGVGEEMVEEPELEQEGGLDLQAGRTERIGLQSYGVPIAMVQHLSARSVQFFRRLSMQWHHFLNLPSDMPKPETSQKQAQADKKRPLSPPEAHKPAAVGALGKGTTLPNTAPLQFPNRPVQDRPRSMAKQEPDPAQLQRALQKVLGKSSASYKSEEQRIALQAVVAGETPLVVVLPTGGGKSMLFLAPACLDDPGVTIVVVPFRELLNSLKDRLQAVSIEYYEWVEGVQGQPATVVVVSADCAGSWGFLQFASQLVQQNKLRRVVIDECHLSYISSDYRERLARLRNLRSLACPFVLLTATQPPCLEHELAEAMLVRTARYIRAITVRPNICYLVQRCQPGRLIESAVQICRQWQRQLAGDKGIVYCRTRETSQEVALELGCPFYHAGLDPEGRVLRVAGWVESGGLIVATSALGTGVDYPGIKRILHVDEPYGMFDYAQESGRGGRGGEGVDSVILIQDRRRFDTLSNSGRTDWRAIDQAVMREFIHAGSGVCRRAVMSAFLDGRKISCADIDGARCDRCGEGVSEWHASQTKDAREQAIVLAKLDELANGCPGCLVGEGRDGREAPRWLHSWAGCLAPAAEDNRMVCDGIRESIHYRQDSHTCFSCGVTQRLCTTGKDTQLPCQWPNVLVPVVAGVYMSGEAGRAVLEQAGFHRVDYSSCEDIKAYCKWLGLRHQRRVWGDLMSNGMVVLISALLLQPSSMATRHE